MRLRIIRKLADHLEDRALADEFMVAVGLRQRAYRDLNSKVLILDPIDLIADHLLLYSERDGKLMCYLRAVTATTCGTYGLELPIAGLMRSRSELSFGYERFRNKANEAMQIFLLCLDPAYRQELRGIKAVELMTWLALTTSGIPREQVSFACTINNRYRQDPAMRALGDWIENVPDMIHPLIPDPHRFVLVPRIREDYWETARKKFAAIYTSLSDGAVDLLADPVAMPSRKAA